MITFYIEANSLGELRLEVCRALSLIMPLDTIGGNMVTQAGPARHYTSPPASYNEQPGEYAGAATGGTSASGPTPEASDKPKRKHRATRPPVAPSEAIKEQMQDIGQAFGGYEEFVPDGTLTEAEADAMNDIAGLGVLPNPLIDNIANEKVKAEVIGRLADLFTAGKVKVLRGILDQYGEGAKSFPEIDAAKFPAIREALDKGLAA